MRAKRSISQIFWALLLIGLLILMGLVYWSSLLQEERLIEIKSKIDTLERKVSSIHTTAPTFVKPTSQVAVNNKNNILKPDPYFEKTLPSKLPKDFKPNGDRKGATIGKPDSLHPFSAWAHIRTWYGLCVASIARDTFGFFEKPTPDLAVSIESIGTDLPEYKITLRDNVYWQPLEASWFPSSIKLDPIFFEKKQVTAHDIKFFFDACMNPYVSEPGAVSLRNYIDDIKEVEVVDDLTLIVRWKTKKYIALLNTLMLRPLPRHIYQYFPDGSKIVENEKPDTYRTSSLWALNFSNHWAKNIIVSCGAFAFDGMTERGIKFKRNPDHYFPLDALVDGYEIDFRNSNESIWKSFKEGSIDTYVVRPDQLYELEQFLSSTAYAEQHFRVNQISYISRSYTYIGWNETNPLFQNKRVRQALTMSIDRDRIIRQNLNGMGIPIHGTFYPFSPSNDNSINPVPFDPIQAKKILAEEGWTDSDRDGILDKDGKPFKFNLSYYVMNSTTKSIVEYIQTALKEVGIEVNLNGLDLADISKQFDDKQFDSYVLAWALGSPPEDPRQLWHSSQADLKGSSNTIGFKNKEADQIIDELEIETDPAKRIELYHRFDRLLNDEQPYTFLYTPKEILLYRDFMKNVFIPKDEIAGAQVGEPDLTVSWIEK